MATIGTLKTLNDWAKETAPDGSVAVVAELLSQKNDIIDMALFKEGNLPVGDQQTIRTGLPTTYWRKMNAGVPVSKATSAQITEQCAQLTARGEIDATTVRLNGNTAEYRMQENEAYIEAMGQEGASTMFYGAASNPEEFVGLANRYNALTGAGNSQNIINGGGTGGSDYTSVWLVGYGPNQVYNIFPKGSTAGLIHEDLGVGDAFDSNNNRFRAYMDYYEMNMGLMVKDWRYAVRICNIDVSDLAGLTGTQATTAATFLPKLMARAIHRLPSLGGIKPMFFMNRTAASLLTVAAMEKSSSAVTIEEGLNQFGDEIFKLKFQKIPVGIADAITEAETEVS